MKALRMTVWIKNLLKSLDDNLDEKTKITIMEACGENCPFTHLTDERLLAIKDASTDEHDFLEKLSHQWRVKIEGNDVYVVFDKCYCPLVSENSDDASATLCYCTLGNLKKKFSIGLNRDIDVLMEKTILSGDDECRFKILI
ncbi:MAG TPA: DUF6144 family protein [Methanocorpusculum sp.]|nr:DUF6144 family protein [Methanocorpusculum sp.]HJJ53390.1 DUF6144 family protein [Methanocorpusculum sp.]